MTSCSHLMFIVCCLLTECPLLKDGKHSPLTERTLFSVTTLERSVKTVLR